MRLPIWKENDYFDLGMKRVDMDPAVVELPEMAYLWWGYNYGDPAGPYGQVTDIRVEGEEITGELRVYDPTFDPAMFEGENPTCRLGGYYNEVKKDASGTNVLECKLRAVSVILLPLSPVILPKVSDAATN